MFLLCDVDSAVGGESVLIDDYAVLAALQAEPEGSAGARLADFLTGTVLDLTSPGMVERSRDDGRATPPRAAPCSGSAPCATASGRWPTTPIPRPPTPSSTTSPSCSSRSGERATRFRAGPGEAICVDNYRVSHSRDAYTDLDRLFWRVWAWSDEALSVPDGKLASDTRYAKA